MGEDREFAYCDWYSCENGHLYLIGECRLPMMMSRCGTCGARIGGRHHQMLDSNARVGAVNNASLNRSMSIDMLESSVQQRRDLWNAAHVDVFRLGPNEAPSAED
eukprot:TRINITY_DN792_c0_g1_i1.p1 TRINITY_DN792_c0_g1~~TRINITY_DN792_c0_g1_i1.p1  ORF type:complete len:115 (+),score=10.73 TRINITY_DN792_c0_g1_i1:33-347(+)